MSRNKRVIHSDMNDWESRHQVMSFRGTHIEFENSRVVYVRPFSAILDSIRLGEWLEFSRSTGYRTQAERDGADETFLANSYVGDEKATGREHWLECAAMCISWEDAAAFCLHYKVRMLTEAEWIVSTYLLFDVDPDDMGGTRLDTALRRKFGQENRIGFAKEEWVSDRVWGEGVVRTGPHYYRQHDWKVMKNWFTAPVHSYDTYRGVRVAVNSDS